MLLRAVVLAVIALLACGAYFIVTSTPEYAIGQVKDAIKSHDRKKFDKYVDTDEFADVMVDDLLTRPFKEAMGNGMIARWVTAGISGIFKPPLVAQMKSDLYELVDKGSISQSVNKDGVDPEMTLGAVDRRICLSKNEFKRVENVRSDGRDAKVTVVLHNKEHDKDFNLDVQMHKMEGYWRVTKLTNFPEFISRIIEIESSHRSDRIENADSIKRI